MQWHQGTSILDISPVQAGEASLLAAMAAARVRALRKAVPLLPERFEEAGQAVRDVEDLCRAGDVLVAREAGRPVGYLGGWRIPEFMGDRAGVFVPECGFGTDSLEPSRVRGLFERLYAVQCGRWCDAGAFNHAVITYETESALRDLLFHGCFGGACMDAIRPAVALRLPVPEGIRIRKVALADPASVAAWRTLETLHVAYMRAAPLLLGSAELPTASEMAEWLQQEGHHAWIAQKEDGTPLSYLQMERRTDGTSRLVDDPHNRAVTGAFTQPDARGAGLGSLLLDAALTCAQDEGMATVSVDFESRNFPASRFWTRHFTPFTFSVLRQVDARAVTSAGTSADRRDPV